MFEFGRELRRLLGAGAVQGDLDPALLELFDTAMLVTHARAADTDAGRVSTRDPYPALIRASMLWRELARRTGDPVALRKAAQAAQAAARAGKTAGDTARGTLEQGLASLTGVDLYGDLALLSAAAERLRAAAGAVGDLLFEARLEFAWARLASREALAGDSFARAMEAAALFDAAVHGLDRLADERASSAARLEAAQARIERADLLAGFGVRRQDARLLEEAASDLRRVVESLDCDYEPITWGRACEVLGSILVSLGELGAGAEHIAEGVSVLVHSGEGADRDASPLDWARARHALAVGLQALGEACDSEAAFDQAETAFDEACEVIGAQPLALRATVANNRAACLARVAERRGDLPALNRAEAVFKAELALAEPGQDPVSWAVLQVNLARVYEARADLIGHFAEREAAIYALEEALDVFCEHGLKTLTETASIGLERVRAAA